MPTSPALVIKNAVCVDTVGEEVEIKNAGAVEVAVRESRAAGEVVPRPKFPEGRRMRSVEVAPGLGPVDEAMVKSGRSVVRMDAPATESRAQGVEVPMPKSPCPAVLLRFRKFAESRVVAPE